MKLTFNTELEQLEYELDTLIRTSADAQFTNYLKGLAYDARRNPSSVPELRRQAIANYDVYAGRMNSMGRPVEPLFFRAIYGGMEAPEVLEKNSAANITADKPEVERKESGEPEKEDQTQAVTAEVSEEKKGDSADVQPQVQTYAQPGQQPQGYAQPMPGQQPQGYVQPQPQMQGAFPAQNSVQPQMNPGAVPQNPNVIGYTNSMIQPVNAGSGITTPKAEYAIGAIVMSVLGSVFLLTGLVYFAINYLDTFAQGMVMYAVCAIVLLVSELVVRRIVPKLSSVFTAIGISGVFLSTVVNYKSLGNINVVAAAVILAICAVLVCLFGFMRKSQLYSVIGFLAAFISSVAIGNHVSAGEFTAITIGTLLISTMWLFFPVAKRYDILTPIMIMAELVYFLATLSFKIDSGSDGSVLMARIVFAAASWFVIGLVYYFADNWTSKFSSDPQTVFWVNSIIMIISAFTYSMVIRVGFYKQDLDPDECILYGVILYSAFVIPQIVFAIIKYNTKSKAFMTYFITLLVTGLLIIGLTDCVYISAPVLVMYAVIVRLFARKNPDSLAYKVIDIVVQSYFFIIVLFFTKQNYDTDLEKYFFAILMLIGLYAVIFINAGFKTAVQIMFVFISCYVVSAAFLDDGLAEATSMGIVLLFTYLINNVGKLKDKYFRVYNYFMLVFDLILLNMASDIEFTAVGLVIFCIAAIFGLAYVILMINKEYGLFFAGYYIAIPVYLTLVSLMLPIDNGFILSTVLMGIALVSVIIGFALKERAIRIYGLVLSILVCAKIALLDFVSIGDAKYKTIMYICVGAFALLIGCIYMVLEARMTKAENIAKQADNTSSGELHG
ncbi:MAG: DUF1720 domain-containing protein [Lachnospiraceae bacterium]|nr:DUF1720 domain-containing protein [Lachnospiraceae bacterium]